MFFLDKNIQFDSVFHNKILKILTIFKALTYHAAFATVHWDKSRVIRDFPIEQLTNGMRIRDFHALQPTNAFFHILG